MGNKNSSSGSGIIIEVTKYALAEDDLDKSGAVKTKKPALPKLSNKVLDKYQFPVNTSCRHYLTAGYILMEKEQRLKVTNVLNDTKINLMKLIVNDQSVEIEVPELFKTFAFSKDSRTEQQLNYLNFYSVVNTVSDVN